MQQQGRDLRAGRLFMAAVALLMATAITGADVVDVGVGDGDCFGLQATITLDSGGGAVELSKGWEDYVDFSVVIDGGGVVLVNEIPIGHVGNASTVIVEVVAYGGSTTVSVFDASCGDLLCTETGFDSPSDADRATASGATVESLTVD